MKNICYITLLSLLLFNSTYAQEREHKEVWCNYWASIINGVYFVDHVSIKGDTTFNTIPYKKITIQTDIYKYAQLTTTHQDSLVSSSTRFIGGYREDSNRVYVAAMHFDTSMNEKLVYDYNLKKEDTAEIWIDLVGYQKFIVDSVFEITINDGSKRKMFTFSEPVDRTPLHVTWIEGIGTNFGLLNMYYIYINDESSYLRCVKLDGATIYDYEPMYRSDCLADPEQNCGTVSTTDANNLDQLEIYPNPVTDYIIINGSIESFKYTLYDLFGRKVLSADYGSTNSRIDISSLISGTYFIKIEHNNNFTTKKVIKL